MMKEAEIKMIERDVQYFLDMIYHKYEKDPTLLEAVGLFVGKLRKYGINLRYL